MALEHRQRSSGALIFIPSESDKAYVKGLKEDRANREQLKKELEEVKQLKKELKELKESLKSE